MGYSHLGKIVAIIAKKGLIKEIRKEREDKFPPSRE